MHGAGRDLRRGDGVDEQPRPMRDIAAGEHIGRGGLVGLRIDLDQPARRSPRRRPGCRNERSEVWPMAKITVSAAMSSICDLVEARIEPSVGVENGGAVHGAQRR